MKYEVKLFWGFIILFIISAINPTSMYDWAIENIITLLSISLLIYLYKKTPIKFSKLAYTFIFMFLCLHLVGSHYIYGEVPLGNWLEELFFLSRNPFDRITHFAFGLLLVIPLKELLEQLNVLGKKGQAIMIVLIIIAIGAIYELIETFAALFMNVTHMEDFVGLQGDIWDAQKDIALAGLGAIITLITQRKMKKKKTVIKKQKQLKK